MEKFAQGCLTITFFIVAIVLFCLFISTFIEILLVLTLGTMALWLLIVIIAFIRTLWK